MITLWPKVFFQLLKRERIRGKTYATRKEARDDVFDYIEFFYNPKRKHGKNGLLSPINFKNSKNGKIEVSRFIGPIQPHLSVQGL